MQWHIFLPLMLMMIVTAGPVYGQEIYFWGGAIRNSQISNHARTWALEYVQDLTKHSAFSVSWVNEGELPHNHRDGIGAQLWGRVNLLHPQFSLEAGIGPYLFYDTNLSTGGSGFSDSHGVGAMASIAGIWHTQSRWLLQLRGNWIETSNSFDTRSVVLGIGYRLDASSIRNHSSPTPDQSERTTKHEITALIGRTIVNSFDSEQSNAQGIEYRYGLNRYLDATIAWLNEGDSGVLRRSGLISQLWIVREFYDDRISLGIGVGPYIGIDIHSASKSAADERQETISAIISVTASYRITQNWAGRFFWNRVATGYNRDTDVVMAGPSYRF